jgi:hypothetical protein
MAWVLSIAFLMFFIIFRYSSPAEATRRADQAAGYAQTRPAKNPPKVPPNHGFGTIYALYFTMRVELQLVEIQGHSPVSGMPVIVAGRLFFLNRVAGSRFVNNPEFRAVEMVQTATLDDPAHSSLRLLRHIGTSVTRADQIETTPLIQANLNVNFNHDVSFGVPIQGN